MFLGENRHAVDDKGRVILPSQYRDELQGGAVMTKEVDGCIAVWPLEDFKVRAQEMADAQGYTVGSNTGGATLGDVMRGKLGDLAGSKPEGKPPKGGKRRRDAEASDSD